MSTERKEIGRIKDLDFGWGGYQDAMIGFKFKLGGKAWSVDTFNGTWASHSERCQWTVEDQKRLLGEAVLFVRDLMMAAHKSSVGDLVDVPIEATFDGNVLRSWRILDEVIG